MKKWRVVAEVDNITDDIAEALGRKIYVQAVEYTVDAETLREVRDKGRPAPGWHIRSIKEIADEGAEAPR
jgi:hypothetical protein